MPLRPAFVFTARRYASDVQALGLRCLVLSCVRLSQVGVLPRWL